MKAYLTEQALSMGIGMTPEQAQRFEAYHALLTEANKSMNLTRVSQDIRESCDRNYLDSLTLLAHLSAARSLIDVGSGAGFPGVPIAIMRPDMDVTLLDALGKRVEFLNRVIEELGLNARAVHMRSEQAAALREYRDAFDAATARAVADLRVLSEWLLPFVRPGGCMLAMKGPEAENETDLAAYAITCLGGKPAGVYDAPVPGRDWSHKIVKIEKLTSTPPRFPRRPGVAEKRPLSEG